MAASAIILSCASAPPRPPPEPFDSAFPPLPTLRNVAVVKRASPGGKVVGETECGTILMFLERRERGSTLVTLRGHERYDDTSSPVVTSESFWIDDADLDQATAKVKCIGTAVMRDPRVPDALARALTPPGFVEAAPWERFDDPVPRRFYRLDDARTSCVEFRRDDGSLSSETIRWGCTIEHRREITLTGPTIKGVQLRYLEQGPVFVPAPNEEVSMLCLTRLFVARNTRAAWEILERVDKGEIWAYPPASATRWFETRAACERETVKGPVARVPFAGCG
jgi:hypothetical protein